MVRARNSDSNTDARVTTPRTTPNRQRSARTVRVMSRALTVIRMRARSSKRTGSAALSIGVRSGA